MWKAEVDSYGFAPCLMGERAEWPGVQFNRHFKFKAWFKACVKDKVKDVFRKALDREMVKA